MKLLERVLVTFNFEVNKVSRIVRLFEVRDGAVSRVDGLRIGFANSVLG